MKTKVYRNTDGQWYIDTYKNNELKSTRKPRFWEKPEYIRMYTEGPCSQIQAYLRAGIKTYDPAQNFNLPVEAVIDGIDKEIENRLGGPVPNVVYRMDNGELLSHRVGDAIVDHGYTSTTVSTRIFSGKFSIAYKIDGLTWDSGCMVDDLSQYDEEEFLLRRGSKFEIVDEKCKTYLRVNGQSVRCVKLRYVGRV